MRGPALAYLDALDMDSTSDFERLTLALKRRFGHMLSTSAAHSQLRGRVQRHGEKLVEYATDIQRLARLAYPKWNIEVIDSLCLQQFLDGVADADIQCRVREEEPSSLNSALELAIRLETSRLATRSAKRAIHISSVQISNQLDNDDAGNERWSA